MKGGLFFRMKNEKGTAGLNVLLSVNRNCPLEKQFSIAQPESRLTSLRGQDRSVNDFLLISHALTTDKGFPSGRIYSLNFIQ